jgi:hypothetical protein
MSRDKVVLKSENDNFCVKWGDRMKFEILIMFGDGLKFQAV